MAETGSSALEMNHSDVERGTLFIQGRLKNDNHRNLTEELSSRLQVEISSSALQCVIGVDILKDKNAKDILGRLHGEAYHLLEFLKVAEYYGQPSQYVGLRFEEVNIHVHIYVVCHNQPSFSDLPNSKVTLLPHEKFEGLWEQLVFNNEIKGHLIRMISNARLLSDYGERETNPVILLHGAPGTGKSTLCRALAQKISIRMSTEYDAFKLIEFKPASLLSKFYSESGQQVETLFQKICELCAENSSIFYCILIDEVESIARSRQKTASHGEVEDSQRVTCELLKGIDNLKEHNNFVVLATTNFIDELDFAFLSRCAHDEMVEAPAPSSQYKILADILEGQMDRGIIKPKTRFQPYSVAKLQPTNGDFTGTGSVELLHIVDKIQTLSSQSHFGWAISGRSLGLLLRTALQRNLHGKACTLDQALAYTNTYIGEKLSRKRERSADDNAVDVTDEYNHTIELHSKSQRKKYTVQWDGEFDEAAFIEYTNTLKAERGNIKLDMRKVENDVQEKEFLAGLMKQADEILREEKRRQAQVVVDVNESGDDSSLLS